MEPSPTAVSLRTHQLTPRISSNFPHPRERWAASGSPVVPQASQVGRRTRALSCVAMVADCGSRASLSPTIALAARRPGRYRAR
jgi:hypothetical protein